MIKVTVFYPRLEGSRFDMSYYCDRDMPMVRNLLSPALKGLAVEQGLAGQAPGSPAPYLAIGHLFFASVEEFQSSFAPHSEAIFGDIPNYTNTQPVVQIREVKIWNMFSGLS
jgi:uncharacterized protein (TIGR02118 family)